MPIIFPMVCQRPISTQLGIYLGGPDFFFFFEYSKVPATLKYYFGELLE